MQAHRYNNQERLLLFGAIFCSALLFYLLRDDSIFDRLVTTNQVRIGRIVELHNDVRHKANRAFQWRTLRAERDLHWGDGVFTGKDSSARILLDDGTEIVLQENSMVIFTPKQNELLLDLRFGQLTGSLSGGRNLQLASGSDLLNLSGPNAKIEVSNLSGSSLSIRVLEGKIATRDSRQIVQTLEAGRVAQVADIAALSENQIQLPEGALPKDRKPAEIRPAWKKSGLPTEGQPVLDEEGDLIQPATFNLIWDEMQDQGGFELEIASDPDFKNLVSKQKVKTTAFTLTLDKPGPYFARVRPELGSQDSWSAVHSFTVKAPEMPLLPAPQIKRKNFLLDGVQASVAKVEWQKIPAAAEYEIEVSRDPDFTEPQKTRSKVTSFDYTERMAGSTFVRIIPLTARGRTGRPSEIVQIQVAGQPPAIEPIAETRVLGKTPLSPPEPIDVKVIWTASSLAKGYELQIAKDLAFTEPIRIKTQTPAGTLNIKDPGTLHVRVRSLDGASQPLSEFSEPQTVTYVYRIPLATPILVEPSNNITMFFQTADAPFYFVWKNVRQAEWYVLEVASDPEFSQILAKEKVTEARYLYKASSKVDMVYWRVKAENGERESHWSAARSIKMFSGRKAAE